MENTRGLGKWTPQIKVSAGLHHVGVTFLATNVLPATELNKPFQRTMNTPGSIPGFQFYPHVGQVTIEGPFNAKGANDTASRRRIFVCRPSTGSGRPELAEGRPSTGAAGQRDEVCARTIVSTLAKRAFRRPATAGDLTSLMRFYNDGRS